jgi:hypothetical protein
MEQQPVDAAPAPAQPKRRRLPELGDGEDAGAIEPLFHARADAVDFLQVEPEQNLGQAVMRDDDEPVGLLQIGPDLAEEDIGRNPDRAGEAFAGLLAESPFYLERQLARDRHLALGATMCLAKGVAAKLGGAFVRTNLLVNSNLDACQVHQFYVNNPIQNYAQLFHQFGINGLAYSFGYDDTCSQSSYITVDSPTAVSIGIAGPP